MSFSAWVLTQIKIFWGITKDKVRNRCPIGLVGLSMLTMGR